MRTTFSALQQGKIINLQPHMSPRRMESSLSSPPSSRVAAFIVRVKSRNGGGGIVDEGKAEEVCRIVALGIKADSNGETNKQKQMRYAAYTGKWQGSNKSNYTF